jgi:hypothetical protein
MKDHLHVDPRCVTVERHSRRLICALLNVAAILAGAIIIAYSLQTRPLLKVETPEPPLAFAPGICGACNGTGKIQACDHPRTCPFCAGKGTIEAVGGPFRPRPKPEPPEPPAPQPDLSDLDGRDRRLFERIQKFLEEREARQDERQERRANRAVQAELLAMADALDKVDAQGEAPLVTGSEGEPYQGMMGALLAGKIAGVAKKIAYWVLMTLIGSALIALFLQFKWAIVGGFILATSTVFWLNKGGAWVIGAKK